MAETKRPTVEDLERPRPIVVTLAGGRVVTGTFHHLLMVAEVQNDRRLLAIDEDCNLHRAEGAPYEILYLIPDAKPGHLPALVDGWEIAPAVPGGEPEVFTREPEEDEGGA